MRAGIERPPLRFYFKYRRRIDEWNNLKSSADAYARDLAAEAADELPVQPGAAVHRDGPTNGWEIAVLYRPNWVDGTVRPRVGVGLAWGPRPNLGTPDGYNGPIWGVWTGERPKGDPVTAAVKEKLRATAAAALFKPSQWPPWPFWRVAPEPQPDWYDHLDEWAAGLHLLVDSAWAAFADELDAVIASLSP